MTDEVREIDRAHWDALAQVHGEGADAYYDIEALAAGRSSLGRLRVDQLSEHLDCEFDPRGRLLTREDDGLFRMRIGGLPAPVLSTLVATRTSPPAS